MRHDLLNGRNGRDPQQLPNGPQPSPLDRPPVAGAAADDPASPECAGDRPADSPPLSAPLPLLRDWRRQRATARPAAAPPAESAPAAAPADASAANPSDSPAPGVPAPLTPDGLSQLSAQFAVRPYAQLAQILEPGVEDRQRVQAVAVGHLEFLAGCGTLDDARARLQAEIAHIAGQSGLHLLVRGVSESDPRRQGVLLHHATRLLAESRQSAAASVAIQQAQQSPKAAPRRTGPATARDQRTGK
jgi:hypothetical protein